MEAQVVGAGVGHYFPSGHLAFSHPLWWLPLMTTPWGPSILVPWLKGWDEGCCCGVGPVVLSGVSSGHVDQIMKVMVAQLSGFPSSFVTKK